MQEILPCSRIQDQPSPHLSVFPRTKLPLPPEDKWQPDDYFINLCISLLLGTEGTTKVWGDTPRGDKNALAAEIVSTETFIYLLLFFMFWLRPGARRILVPPPGMEAMPPALGAES